MGIFAQVDAGKTTLSEALLYETGQLKKRGRVDHGDAFLDHHSLERSRGITIFSKEARFPLGENDLTLLDTPGHVDFAPQAERVMQVLDYAVLLISGTDGVQAHTETLWKLLRRYHVPTFLFFNKMDLPGSDRERLLADAGKRLSDACLPLEDSESAALCDEEVLSRYLETGTLEDSDIVKMVQKEELFPCFFGSALEGTGVRELLSALKSYAQPVDFPEEFSARVYKISRDAQGNRLAFLRVTGGNLHVRDPLGEEKVSQLRLYSGGSFTQAEVAEAGQVCAVLGTPSLQAGDVLGAASRSLPSLLSPVMTYRIHLPAGADPRTVLPRLRQLEEEEPELHLVWDEDTREIHAQLMGQVQIEVLESLIKDRFNLDVTIDEGQVSYRETITGTVEGVGHFEPLRHYAEVHLILEPLPRGSGLEFCTCCSEDQLDRNWQRLILTHLQEKVHKGVLTGSPITDMRLTLAAGRAHLKHTEGGDFRQATYRAVRQGLMKAESILLEPFYHFVLSVPAPQIGRAISDVRLMGGSFGSPQEEGTSMVLEGEAPVAEMQGYMQELTSYTRGQGRLFCQVSGYEPCHNTEAVLERLAYDPLEDTENTPDSVFCSHGAGTRVPWDQVSEHMHLESVLPKKAGPAAVIRKNLDLDEKALEAIMEREFGPEKHVLYKAPVPKEDSEVSLPPPRKEYLIVDGYNMIFAWDGLREQAQTDISGARESLLDILSNYCGFHPCELVVVFDSYRVKGGTGSKSRRDNLHVVYTREYESADQYIEALTGEIGRNYRIRVATSDALVQLSALRSGVLRVSARELLLEVESVNERIADYIRKLQQEARRAAQEDSPFRSLVDKKSCP